MFWRNVLGVVSWRRQNLQADQRGLRLLHHLVNCNPRSEPEAPSDMQASQSLRSIVEPEGAPNKSSSMLLTAERTWLGRSLADMAAVPQGLTRALRRGIPNLRKHGAKQQDRVCLIDARRDVPKSQRA